MSAARSRVALVLAAALVLLYGARAVTGWVGGTAYGAGRRLAEADRFAEALPLLDRGARGPDLAAARWLAGSLRMNLFQSQQAAGASDDELAGLLEEAYRDATEAISISPASGWYWAGLADVYHQVERRERYRRGRPLSLVGTDPWDLVGRPGRVAIGLLREAIEREPTAFVFRDQLAFALLGYGLRDEALEVVRGSARMQPDFGLHAYTNLRPLPPEVIDAFAEASRAALGDVPLMGRGPHLLALAKLEMRRGGGAQAVRDLRQAMDAPVTEIQRADAWYWLGFALEDQARYPEAIEAYVHAGSQAVFEAPALAGRARIAETLGYSDRALALLRWARYLKPRDINLALSYARLAGETNRRDWAEEALRWAALVHDDDPRPLRELERLYRQNGEISRADDMNQKLVRLLTRTHAAGS